ncbi:MAG: hypothetical protein IJB97_08360 [Clostridia bacterium]|nr:hypothetical protein [Clostridia bacterium]
MQIPYIAGEWKILFQPEKFGNYVNDHSIICANDGTWHLFGITSFGGGPSQEKYFVHGVGADLLQPMREVGKSIDRGTLAWAPCVVEKDGTYYMFYGPSPTQLAVSFELTEWFGYSVTLENEPLMAAHRDHFVLKVSEDRYLMYVVGMQNKRGAVSVFESSDLSRWQFKGYALTSGKNAPLSPPWGAMESPYVVCKNGEYYLFVTYTDCSYNNYSDTLVFASKDPMSFGEYDGETVAECDGVDGRKIAKPVTKLKAHAPEIINVGGEYYITTCGWRGQDLPNQGCVSIAPLQWK